MSQFPGGYYPQPTQYYPQQQPMYSAPPPHQPMSFPTPQQVSTQPTTASSQPSVENSAKICKHIQQLLDADTREQATAELSKLRESCPNMALMLWYSVGSIAALLQEVISVYPLLNPPVLPTAASNRVSNSLALLQCVASHSITRKQFLEAQMPLFLYPFLSTSSSERPFEYLRLTSLGVVGALVKSDDQEVIGYLLRTEIVPLCLRIMEKGTELSKTVATFVVQKILLSDDGLNYICHTPDRFTAVVTVLRGMVTQTKDCTARLLRHIIRCYLRLSDHPRAKDALKQCLPEQLRDLTYIKLLQEDNNMKKWLGQLLVAIEDPGAKELMREGH